MLEEIIRRKVGYKTWWDTECRMKKRKVAKALRKWKREIDRRKV